MKATHGIIPSQARHRLAAPSTWPWLPTAERGVLAKHALCAECGAVGAIGGERPLAWGTLLNVLATLYRRLEDSGIRVTTSQRRLVARRLVEAGVADTFGLTRHGQLELVERAIADMVSLSQTAVRTYLRSC